METNESKPLWNSDIIKFLYGEQDYNGKWFGDKNEKGKSFWWRIKLRYFVIELNKERETLQLRIKELEDENKNLESEVNDLIDYFRESLKHTYLIEKQLNIFLNKTKSEK